MSCKGEKHGRFSIIHRRRASLDGDQLGHRHVVGVKSPIQELPEKMEERIRPNNNSNCKEELQQQQQRKSVWDCESSLYDSFELYTFSRQLNRAIVAASTPSSLVNNYQLMDGIRSWSMPHYVPTKRSTTSTEWQYSPVNVEINLQEEKSRSQVVEGNTRQFTIHYRHQNVAQNEVEHRLDSREIQKTHNKRLGFPRSVQRLFTRLFQKRPEAASRKLRWKLKQMISIVTRYIQINKRRDIIGILQAFRFIRSEFVSRVRNTASSRKGPVDNQYA